MARLVKVGVRPSHGRGDVEEDHRVNLDRPFMHLMLHPLELDANGSRRNLWRVTLILPLLVGQENIAIRAPAGVDALCTAHARVRLSCLQ